MKKNLAITIFGITALFLCYQFFKSGPDKFGVSSTSEVEQSKKSEIQRSIASEELGPKLKKLNDLENCLDSRKCGFSKNDSREYDLAVGRAIKREIEDLYELVSDEEIEDEWVSEVARRYLSFKDGHIKEAALMLISTQPPGDENLEAVLDNVISFHSAPLAELGLLELSKYETPAWKSRIDKNFIKNLKSGSLVVRQLLARRLSQFITSENRDMYREFASTTKDSKVKSYIEAALSNY